MSITTLLRVLQDQQQLLESQITARGRYGQSRAENNHDICRADYDASHASSFCRRTRMSARRAPVTSELATQHPSLHSHCTAYICHEKKAQRAAELILRDW
jgi:hypothetical protein